MRIKKDEYEHFVVYRGILNDRVFLADSIRGNIRLSICEFSRQWTDGAVLVVAKAVRKASGRCAAAGTLPRLGTAGASSRAARTGLNYGAVVAAPAAGSAHVRWVERSEPTIGIKLRNPRVIRHEKEAKDGTLIFADLR